MDGHILRDFIDNQKLTKKKIAGDLNMSRTNLYQFFGSQIISEENRKMFEKYFNAKIFTETSKYLHPLRKKTVPFYDAPAVGGVTETDMTPIHAPSGTIDIGDLLNDSVAAIRIYGNSMLPNYPPGCVVGLAKIKSTFIEPGEVYVIETADRRMLKRLFYPKDNPDGSHFTCYSDNTMLFDGGARNGKLAYPPFDIPKKEIINMFVVTGVIKRNANSVIINR